MNIDYLKEFIVLSTQETFQDAASQLFLSQSSLSKHIQALSSELGTELFYLENRKMHLSSFGKDFLPIAMKISDLYDLSLELAGKKRNITKLSIGTDLSDSTWLTTLLPEFIAEYPEISVECLCSEYTALEQMLKRNKLSIICFNSINESFPDIFETISYKYDTLYAVLPKSHKLAESKQISLIQLKHDNFVEKFKYSASYNILTKLCALANFEPYISIYVSRRTAQLDLVSQGLAVAIIEKSALDIMNLKDKHVVTVKLTAPNSLYYIFMQLKHHSSQQSETFLQFIEERFQASCTEDAKPIMFSPQNYLSK
ncbi:MAG: LysR family transcriptional regulator [Lachnospiraceae bacterium]